MAGNKTNKELAFEGIKGLVEKFENNYKQFHASDYNETLTRQDFINPFFEYLGWDISNKQGYSQTYREVIHEDKLKIGKETKAPDYSFRIGGNRVFFVEAKKPSLNLKEDSDAAYQVKRYAWSGKLAVSILTDFEEFAIYDCSKKPSPNDKASMSRIEYINYKDYLNKFDFLYDTFAKENVLKGSLEKYNAETKNKKGTESVDIDFLNSLDNLRTKLASSISKLNNLSERDLNFAVQHIIDRIIFLRVAEDRGVENYGDLRDACAGENYYQNIVEIFKKADGKYNSGIFDFRKDMVTQNIKAENKIIKEIINDLYYPKSPYEFSVISVEIIGNAYEQFLGKTITIGNNHKAKIELKPEVRKAGGVYYTPEYIVDYIVENTVGEKIKGKTPKEISNIKIVDPACGSGSFLLGAYKYLLNYHREYYSKQGKKKFLGSKEDAITEDGDLALWVKKQILINNIFGVDIDSNAVEVTKLSLLLKCMEGETPASIMNNQSLFNERALPSLDENIKCGNSLIGNDFYSYNYNNMFKPIVDEKANNRQGHNGNIKNMERRKENIQNMKIGRKGLKPLVIKKQNNTLNLFDEEMQYKINCFDWEKEFPKIFSRKKKEVKAYHITFVLHNSRVSERMITYKVSKGEVLNLSEEDELFITKSIGEVILKNDIKCLAYNISSDHVHILLVCGDKELTEIVRKIKGYSSYSFREYLNIPKGEEFHLWAQKYDAKEIGNDERLYNTIEYINNNRIKHELPENKGLQPLALSFLCGQKGNSNNNVALAHCVNNSEIAHKGLHQRDIHNSDNNEASAHCVKNTEEINSAYNNVALAHCVKIANGRNKCIEHKGLKPLVIKFEDAFNEAFNQYENGGFDIVIGNPPYGAELMDIERNYLERKYNLSNTNTAALFIGLSKHLLKDKGVNGFIIPKSFIYASNWEGSRELIINDLQELVDCGKVWKEVKLEQVIIMFCNNSEVDTYKASERHENNIITVGKIDKKTFREFGFYLNAVSNKELNIAYKMISSQKTVNDFCINRRGVGEQKHCLEEINPKKEYYKVLGGKNISRYYFPDNAKKYISKEYIKDDKAFIEKNSILAQRIVSYTEIPKPSIAIRAIPANIINSLNKYILVDTINQLSNKSEYSTYFILAILNSKLISWYSYRFIYSKAIMTMQFDNPTTSRIPMPLVDLSKKSDKEIHDKLVNLVDSIIEINKKLNNEKNPDVITILKRQVQSIDDNIDKIVYGLYELTEEEINIIEDGN